MENRKWNNDMKKHEFASIMEETLKSNDFSKCIINEFKACGLYPFNAEAVEYNIMNKKIKKKINGIT